MLANGTRGLLLVDDWIELRVVAVTVLMSFAVTTAYLTQLCVQVPLQSPRVAILPASSGHFVLVEWSGHIALLSIVVGRLTIAS